MTCYFYVAIKIIYWVCIFHFKLVSLFCPHSDRWPATAQPVSVQPCTSGNNRLSGLSAVVLHAFSTYCTGEPNYNVTREMHSIVKGQA